MVREQLAQGLRTARVVDQHLRSAVLEQHLPTAPAGHEDLSPAVRATEGDQTSTAGGVEVAGKCALGAQPQTI